MAWTCPACSIQIEHEQDRPLPKKIYRCHVCRLELVLDDNSGKLVVAPFAAPNRPDLQPMPIVSQNYREE